MLIALRKRMTRPSGVPAGDAAGEQAAAEKGALEPALAVHAAAAEAGGLARREESVDRARRCRRERGTSRSVWMPPMLLRLMTCSRIAISGPAPRSSDRLEGAGPDAVAGPAPQPGDAPQLLVVVEALAAPDRRVVAGDGRLDGRRDRRRRRRSAAFMRSTSSGSVAACTMSSLLRVSSSYSQRLPNRRSRTKREPRPFADRRVELGAGDRELAQRDPPVQQLPAVAAGLAADARDEVVRVESRTRAASGRCARRAH